MIISVPSLMPQMVGFLGSTKFHYASFFVDDRSDFTFVHHQTPTSTEDTIKSKRSYKAELRKHGKSARHYHAENGTYAVDKCREDIENSKQTLNFCGVGFHRQNGKAENCIKIICNLACSIIFYSMDL